MWLCGYSWLCVGVAGCVWLCLVVCGYAWLCGCRWLSAVVFGCGGYLWLCVVVCCVHVDSNLQDDAAAAAVVE
jgi:hypothetical protein